MSKENVVKKEGVILEALPNTQFSVKMDEGIMRCVLSGRMRINKINVLVGDRVEVEFPKGIKFEDAIGRIFFRKK